MTVHQCKEAFGWQVLMPEDGLALSWMKWAAQTYTEHLLNTCGAHGSSRAVGAEHEHQCPLVMVFCDECLNA